MFDFQPVWIVYLIYCIYILFNTLSLRFFIRRVTHATLFSLSALAGYVAYGTSIQWHLVVGPGFLFFSTYIINAFYDRSEDETNGRLLELSENHLFLQYVFILGFLGSLIETPKVLAIFLGLFILTELYHNPKTRFKRILGFQSLSEGLGAGLCFSLAGFHGLGILFAMGFGLLSQIKDVSDYPGDSRHQIRTLFTVLVEKHGVLKANIMVNALFISMVKVSLLGSFVLIFIYPSYLLFYGILFLVVVHEGFSLKAEHESYGREQDSEVNIYYANLFIIGQLGFIATLGGLF